MKMSRPFTSWLRGLTHGRRELALEHDIAQMKTAIQHNLVGQLVIVEKIDRRACENKKLIDDLYRELSR